MTSAPPTQVNTLPGLGGTTTLTLQNVGNVAANEALLATSVPGLTISGLSSPVAIGLNGAATQTLTLTPAANVPLNTTLQPSITIGPAALQNVVSVVNVTPSETFAKAGDTVDVSADVLNGVTQAEQAQASFTLLNSSNNVVFTSNAVPLTLSLLTNVATMDLGNLNTSALTPGAYTIDVSIADGSGNPIPGATGTASLVIGAPVTARLVVDSDAIAPDDPNTAFSTLTVGSPTQQSVTAEATVPTTGVAVVVPDSFKVQLNQIIPGNGNETLVWNLTLAPGANQQITWETTLNGLAAGQVVAVASGVSFQDGSQRFTLPSSNVAGVPDTQTLYIPVDVVAPGVPALDNAAVAANQIGDTNLANQLSNLSIALTNLEGTPTSTVYPGQAIAALASRTA